MSVVLLVTPLTIHGIPAPEEPGCPHCNYDTHRCHGCGEWLYHGTEVCPRCLQEIRRGR